MAAAPFLVARNLYLYRHMLGQMVSREIKGRFAGSVGGLLWHFLHPILMLASYLFVFIYIFNLKVGTAGGPGNSALFLVSGLFPWIIFAEGFSRGTVSVVENANLIQKTSFPTEILTAKAVIAPLLSYGIALGLLCVYQIATGRGTFAVLLLPLVVLLQVFFTLGLSFITVTLTVFFRDTIQLVHVVVSFWIFLTPILYPVTMLPEWARGVMLANPLYPLTATYQALFMEKTFSEWHLLGLAALWATAFFLAGTFVFTKLKDEFADWL